MTGVRGVARLQPPHGTKPTFETFTWSPIFRMKMRILHSRRSGSGSPVCEVFTDTATNAEFYGATVTIPRLLTVQAN